MESETPAAGAQCRVLVVAGPEKAPLVVRDVVGMKLPNCRIDSAVSPDEALSAFRSTQPRIVMVCGGSFQDRGRRVFDAIFKECCGDRHLKMPRFLFCRHGDHLKELKGIIENPDLPPQSTEVLSF